MIRKLITYRSPDVSPYAQRPGVRQLRCGSLPGTSKAFLLPYVRLVQKLPIDRKRVRDLYRKDAGVLNRFPSLSYQATMKVIELVR